MIASEEKIERIKKKMAESTLTSGGPYSLYYVLLKQLKISYTNWAKYFLIKSFPNHLNFIHQNFFTTTFSDLYNNYINTESKMATQITYYLLAKRKLRNFRD